MRVLIIAGAGYVSGKEKIMLSLLKGLAGKGDEVFCITSSWGNGQFEELLVNEKISYTKMRLGFISKTLNWAAFRMTAEQLIYWPKLLYDYKKIISRFKPDAVIHCNFHHLFLLYPVVKGEGPVNIYHSHESIANGRFYKRLFSLFNKKVKLFVGVSGYVTNKMAELGINSEKLKTIHNGLEIIEAMARPVNSGNIFNIGIVGQVGRWKGHEDLLLALDILRNAHAGIRLRLLIFGDGKPDFMKEIKEFIDQKQLQEFVEWKGFVKDISDIYPGVDVVCIPTRTEEPFATSALEAGLFAIPVIVTRKGGFPEIVKDGYSGFIVEANSPHEIADRISKLIQNRELAVLMGSNHHDVVTQMFSYDRFLNDWRNALSGSISQQPIK